MSFPRIIWAREGGGGGPLSGVLSHVCYVIQDMGEGGGTDD